MSASPSAMARYSSLVRRTSRDGQTQQPEQGGMTPPGTRMMPNGCRRPLGWGRTSSRKVGRSGPTASVTLSSRSVPLATAQPGEIVDMDAPDPVVPPPPDGKDGKMAQQPGDVVEEHAVATEQDGGTDHGEGHPGLGQGPLDQCLPPEVGRGGLDARVGDADVDDPLHAGPLGRVEEGPWSWPRPRRGRSGRGRTGPSRCCRGWWPLGATSTRPSWSSKSSGRTLDGRTAAARPGMPGQGPHPAAVSTGPGRWRRPNS